MKKTLTIIFSMILIIYAPDNICENEPNRSFSSLLQTSSENNISLDLDSGIYIFDQKDSNQNIEIYNPCRITGTEDTTIYHEYHTDRLPATLIFTKGAIYISNITFINIFFRFDSLNPNEIEDIIISNCTFKISKEYYEHDFIFTFIRSVHVELFDNIFLIENRSIVISESDRISLNNNRFNNSIVELYNSKNIEIFNNEFTGYYCTLSLTTNEDTLVNIYNNSFINNFIGISANTPYILSINNTNIFTNVTNKIIDPNVFIENGTKPYISKNDDKQPTEESIHENDKNWRYILIISFFIIIYILLVVKKSSS